MSTAIYHLPFTIYRSLALSLPLSLLMAGCGGSSSGKTQFTQVDRLARPAVNELFATVANNRHRTNNMIAPTNDSTEIANDIQFFMTNVAGRSQATTDVVKAVLVPDVMVADLSQTTPAYLGVETAGATGGLFGGRALTDDVIDISLGAVFGNTVSALALAPDDGKEIATLTSDNTDASGKHFSATFPYLGPPQT
jgi:hypothetical protein